MKLYLDSMLWVYFFELNPRFHPPTRDLITRCQAAGHSFLSSYLVLAEVLVVPVGNRDVFTAARYRRLFQSKAISLVPFGLDPAERFADLRAAARVKPADAQHLAMAASAGADCFVTYDAKLHSLSVPGIATICSPENVP